MGFTRASTEFFTLVNSGVVSAEVSTKLARGAASHFSRGIFVAWFGDFKYLQIQGTNEAAPKCRVTRNLNNSVTDLIVTTVPVSDGDEIKLVRAGDVVTFYVNGVSRGTANVAEVTGTHFGYRVYAGNEDQRWSRIEALGPLPA